MKKVAIVYYSYSGHTKQIVDQVLDEISAQVIEIIPEEAYSNDYDMVVNQGYIEVEEKAEPAILNSNQQLRDVDVIILASPIWWYTFAPVVRTFLAENDVTGKTIYPLFTNGGYGIGHSMRDLQSLAKSAVIKDALDVPFDNDQLLIHDEKLTSWIHNIKEVITK